MKTIEETIGSKYYVCTGQTNREPSDDRNCAGILEQSMGARNQVGIGLPYRPAIDCIFKLLRSSGIDSGSLCSLAGRYDNPMPTRFLAPIDWSKIPALLTTWGSGWKCRLQDLTVVGEEHFGRDSQRGFYKKESQAPRPLSLQIHEKIFAAWK